MTDVPKHIWNIGTDFKFTKKTMLNIHYRGNSGAWVKWTAPADQTQSTYKKLKTSHYIDMNLHNNDIFLKGMNLNVFVKNLLNNQDYLPGGDYGAYQESLGRKYGFDLSYAF